MSLKKLKHDAYTVGWICPLEVEQIAAMEMLDEEHDSLTQTSRDTNIYNLGSISKHNIVIAGLPKTGNCSAATVVTQMKMTFPNLRYCLLVGIGGGVPVKTDHGIIRLGHVVVSVPTDIHSGALQYDHGKAMAGYFERKGFLAPPPTPLLNAAREIAVQRQRMDHDPIWKNTQRIQTNRPILHRFKFPGAATDHLYQPDCEHLQIGVPCGESGCDPKKRFERLMDDEEESFIILHRGTVASGELVIRNAEQRDNLAREHKVLCFEMEAAGVLTDFPCLVIRGISDYCDSHKNNVWHGYAAAVAAAYARQLFFYIPSEREHEPYTWDPIVQATEPPSYAIPITLDAMQALLSKAREQNLRSSRKVKKSAEVFQAHDALITAMRHNLISFLKCLLLYVGLPMVLLGMLEERLQENGRAIRDTMQSSMEIVSELDEECENASRTLDEITSIQDLIKNHDDGSAQSSIDREHQQVNAESISTCHQHNEHNSGLEGASEYSVEASEESAVGSGSIEECHQHNEYASELEEASEYSIEASEELIVGSGLIEECQSYLTQTPVTEEYQDSAAGLSEAHEDYNGYTELKKKLSELQQECILLQKTVEELQTERDRVNHRLVELEAKLQEAERIRLEMEGRTIWRKVSAWLYWLLSCGSGD